ncbi:alpha/beta fold hydrolase [Cellulomonas chengniuliangii]|uniref:Alpha/beta hydrolase n=1 Tax=Cellulomonas chengniuliangii TaxID=2968084 RepID=A0ABY5KX00_9CELL|nr:alpha/beta hydrolase [Cellulomonas chengniuliangii]MCC2309422.1 alpha/beta hydrolase [Cellulomonas chengniuliangii]MCC2316693.1 alpha/beta hydrolase [Cellulomonas chengniuliangii]UUI75016.1 alpha/beta hydrolase [Cellulomonas chengniuliangii]
MTTDSSALVLDGPWRHQLVPANGARFHVAVAGPDDRDAPMVVLLHGLLQFWWAWRHQLPALGDAGYRVVAMDLRGAGSSDKPPQGYDMPTLTRDVAGVVRSMGADSAVIVGHGLGGDVAWSMPAYHPSLTEAVAAVGAPHPLRTRSEPRSALAPAAARRLAYFQLPYLPERSLTRTDLVARVMREWGAPGWLDDDVAETYRRAARVPFAAHSAMEQARWVVRSGPRLDGRRYLAALRAAPAVPVLQVHGELDGCRPAGAAPAVGHIAASLGAGYRFEKVAGAGHYVPEEAPDRVNELLLAWLDEVAPV